MVTIPHEVIPGLPFDEYKKRDGINGSILVEVVMESLATVKAIIDGARKKESDALQLGTAFHALLLEGKRDFVEQPATYPSAKDGDKPWTYQANFCKAWRDEQTLPILTAGEIVELDGMVNAIRNYEERDAEGKVTLRLSDYLKGESELSVFAEQNGVPVKIRVDLLPADEAKPVIDFKKARSAEPVKFTKQAEALGYHIKAAFYLDVLKLIGRPRKSFWFVSVEQEFPHNVSIIEMDDSETMSFIPAGRRIYRSAIKKLLGAMKRNYWPTYGRQKAENVAPKYVLEKMEAA